MDIRKAFTYLFDDPEWITKVLIGGILNLFGFLIIPSLLVGGYMIVHARRVALGEDTRLPRWENWGEYLAKGILSVIINFVYSLPIIVLGACLALVSAAFGSDGSNSNNPAPIIASVCLGLPMLVYGLVIAFVLPAARLRYAVTDDLGAAFRFGEVFALINSALDRYLTFVVVSIAALLIAFVVTLVTLPLCGLGILVAPFVTFWSYGVWAYALGQFYAARGTTAIVPSAPVA